MRFVSLLTSVACVGALTIPTSVWAQGTEPAEEAAPEAAAAEPAAEPAPAPEPMEAPPPAPMADAAEPAPVAADASATVGTEAVATAEAPAEEEDAPVEGWFRVDHDSLNLQLWFGATHSLGPVDIATDVYVDSGSWGEFDIGPWFEVGLGGDNSLGILPMAGIAFDWAQQKAVSLVAPQLFLYLTAGPVYWESWTQTFLYSPFEDGADNDLYLRNFILFSLSDHVAIGPQMENTIALNNDRDALASMPVGGRINLNYGENNTLGLFLGYQTVEDARQVETGAEIDATTGEIIPTYSERAVAGRITFIRTW